MFGQFSESKSIFALDIETGNLLWEYKSDNSIRHNTISIGNDKVYLIDRPLAETDHINRGEKEEPLKPGNLVALDAKTGNMIWEAPTRQNLPDNYSSSSRARPLVNDSIIFAEPETFDLFSGRVLDNNFERSYGCGIISGSKKMLLFRSATVGYYLFDDIDSGIHNYGGIRPGCWINMIPAGGLVLMPDATNRCDCSYLIKSWIALKPEKKL